MHGGRIRVGYSNTRVVGHSIQFHSRAAYCVAGSTSIYLMHVNGTLALSGVMRIARIWYIGSICLLRWFPLRTGWMQMDVSLVAVRCVKTGVP